MADNQRKVGAITYREAGHDYFAKRTLRRHAGVWSLWALGVAAVISGDFFGWQFGLAYGFGGLLVAMVVITIMYFGLCYSIAEMSPALPHTGGAYSFARSAMGPWGGFATGVAETIEYVVTPAVIVVGISNYMNSITDDLFSFTLTLPWWWLIFYVIFVGLNYVGVEASFRFTVIICFTSLAILLVFFIGAIPNLDFQKWAIDTNGGWFIDGVPGVFYALPFAIWFYLAIEELPLAAEESADPARDIPKGTMWGLRTLVVTGFLVLFLNSGDRAGIQNVGRKRRTAARRPADDLRLRHVGLDPRAGRCRRPRRQLPHDHLRLRPQHLLALAGGLLPAPALGHRRQKADPARRAASGCGPRLGRAYIIWKNSETDLGASLLYMAVFGAVISYLMQCVSFILLRRNRPNINRPFRSPVGIPGAAIAGVIALLSLGAILYNDEYRPGVYGVAIVYVVALAYFAIAGRHRLVLSPEEEFAMTKGEHAQHPEEVYAHTRMEGLEHPAPPDVDPGAVPPPEEPPPPKDT